MGTIGSRVRERIQTVRPDTRQKDIAETVGMPPDAFSRALNDDRQFSSIELARVADYLSADLHWLITGEPDPNRLTVAARHSFDAETWERSVPGRARDEQTIQDIALAYRQAYPEPAQLPDLPLTTRDVRAALGEDFVRPFANRIEERLGVGVVRVPELSTAYSFIVGGRRVIAISATGNWFHENFSLAHELAHLVLGHHDEGLSQNVSALHEQAADDFAAELLLPAEQLGAVNWDALPENALAKHVWEWGISTKALALRLNNLLQRVPAVVGAWATRNTQRLLRWHLGSDPDEDEITRRMDDAATRRFPQALIEAHLERIAVGAVGKGTLAWMMGVDPGTLEVDTPDIPEIDADDLAAALGL